MRFNLMLFLGFNQGFGFQRNSWRNQYGYGVSFELKCGFFRIEGGIESLNV